MNQEEFLEKIAKIKEEHPNIKKLSMIEREGKEEVDKFIKYVKKILNKNEKNRLY